MGLFDGWINGFLYGLGIKKKKVKKYFDTDEKKFEKNIPEGEAFIFLTSDRNIEPFKGGFDIKDFFRGGIQGVSKSYWIHAGIGYKKNGVVYIIESLEKITKDTLNRYYAPHNQLILFFPPISKEQSTQVWERALTKEGNGYDYGDIFNHISVLRKMFKINWGDAKKFVCGSYARWAFLPDYETMNPKIEQQMGKPSDIFVWLNPKTEVKKMVYNLDPNIAN